MFKRNGSMDLKNLISSLGLFSQNQQPQQSPQSQYYPPDVITQFEQGANQSCSAPPPPPQNTGGFSIQNLLPILLLAISGKSNFGQILSKVASLSPELKNLESLTKLLSAEEKPKTPSIDSYKRIE